MNHIFQNIEGWFSFPNLYTNIVKLVPNNSHFVEVGTWYGRSAAYMAVEIVNSNKNIKFDCVDTWIGSDEEAHKKEIDVINNTLYDSFLKNIEPVKDYINPIRMDSIKASFLYPDNSLDFVFIDASHDYENVKKDLEAWYPKVKSGGIFAGHDYVDVWKGVIQAVDEFLEKKKYSLNIKSEFCWGIVKR
jgi:cephalosporin hydroxylase